MFYAVWTFSNVTHDYKCLYITSDSDAAFAFAKTVPEFAPLWKERGHAPVIKYKDIEALLDALMSTRYGKMEERLQKLCVHFGLEEKPAPEKAEVVTLQGGDKFPADAQPVGAGL